MYVLEESDSRSLEVGAGRTNYPSGTQFPTDYFDKIRVVRLPAAEEVPGLVKELYRSLKPQQFLFIDTKVADSNFRDALATTHFGVRSEGDVLAVQKPSEKRVQILVPPGIGDSYWSLVKLQSFLATNKLGLPDVTLLNERAKDAGMRDRAIGFVEMFPFVHAKGAIMINQPNLKMIWHEAYMIRGRRVFKNVGAYDYFLCYNGHLRYGAQLDNIDPEIKCDWHPPMFSSLEQWNFRTQMHQKYDPYFVCYFPLIGSFTHWTKEFSTGQVVQTINQLSAKLKMRPLLIGAGWDRDDPVSKALFQAIHDGVNLMGATNVPQLFGVLKGAQFVIGYPSGPSMMAAAFGIRTLLIWNHFYNKDFAYYCVPPDVRRKTYFADWTRNLTPERVVSQIVDLLETGTIDEKKYPCQVPDGAFRYQTAKR